MKSKSGKELNSPCGDKVPTGTPRLRKQTRSALLDVSLDLFNTEGFDGASIALICKKANMPSGSLTYYFPKKRDIVLALKENFDLELTTLQADLLDQLQSGEKVTSPDELYRLMHAMLTTIWRHRFFFTSMIGLHRLDRHIYVAFTQVERQVRFGLTQLIQKGVTAGEIRPAIYPNSVSAMADNVWYLMWGCMFFQAGRDTNLKPAAPIVINTCLLQFGAMIEPMVSPKFIEEFCREVTRS